jgi:hypothetical protein
MPARHREVDAAHAVLVNRLSRAAVTGRVQTVEVCAAMEACSPDVSAIGLDTDGVVTNHAESDIIHGARSGSATLISRPQPPAESGQVATASRTRFSGPGARAGLSASTSRRP